MKMRAMQRLPLALGEIFIAPLTGPLIPCPDEQAENNVEFVATGFHSVTKKPADPEGPTEVYRGELNCLHL